MLSKDKPELNQDENEVVQSEEKNSESTEETSDSVVEDQKEEEQTEVEALDSSQNVSSVDDTSHEEVIEASEGSVEEKQDQNEPIEEPQPEVEKVTEEPVLEQPPVSEPVEETSVSESVEETPVSETVEETPVSESVEETPVSESVEETPVSETVEETPVSEPVEETPASESVEETPVTSEEESSDPAPVGEEEVNMHEQIEKILAEEEDFEALVARSNANELILILDYFTQAEEIRPYIRKAGLVKKAFDAMRDTSPHTPAILSRFSTALSRFNKKRSEYYQSIENEKEQNSQIKREMLEKLKEIVDSEDMNRYNEVRDIQNKWKSVGFVRKEDMEPLFREYRFLLDKFYKMREMYFQLRDYDRQINLTEKEKLLIDLANIIPEEGERDDRDVWQAKNDLLTDIQLKWKTVGHVPREDMDRINEAYRSITEQFFSLRHEFYESEDNARQENADLKSALLEKMQTFKSYASTKPKEWNEATLQLRELQEEWKGIGRAPQEVNSNLWKEYRAIGNAFFTAKAEFFRNLDETRNENLNKKRALCEEAEALSDNRDWEKTAKELKRLQREWKEVGPVPDRYSNKIWKRFRAACDLFFENRRSHYDELRSDEEENLKAKKELIEEVKKVSVEDAGSAEKAIEQIKAIQARWKEVGRVPYKDKDTIWKEFRAEIDQFFGDLRSNRSRHNYAQVKKSVNALPEDKRTRQLRGRIAKLRRRMEGSKSKIESYSTNILFISKGKSGDSLRAQIQKEIDKEKRVYEDMQKQMRELQDLLKNPPKEKEETPEEKTPEEKKAEGTEEVAAETVEVKEEEKESASTEEEASAPEVEAETPEEEAPVAEKESEEATAETPAEEESEDSSSEESEDAKEETKEEV